MTKVHFRSASHYDAILATLAGKNLPITAEQELERFVHTIQGKWNQYNDTCFDYYASIGLTLPDTWYVYPIHANGKTTSFSEPTTLLIKENTDEFFAMLIHELCHVFCGFDQNDPVITPVWEIIENRFSDLGEFDRGHILVNVLARAGLRHVLGVERAENIVLFENSQ